MEPLMSIICPTINRFLSYDHIVIWVRGKCINQSACISQSYVNRTVFARRGDKGACELDYTPEVPCQLGAVVATVNNN